MAAGSKGDPEPLRKKSAGVGDLSWRQFSAASGAKDGFFSRRTFKGGNEAN